MIRVLHIVPRLDLTGVAKFILNHWNRMNKSEFVFDFVNHGGPENFHSDLINEGCKIFNLPFPHEVGNLVYYRMLRDIIRKGKYDIIHIHTGHYTGFTALMCSIYSPKSKVICHAHTTKCMNPSHEKLMPLFRLMARIFADKLFACGHEAGVFCFGKKARFEEIHNAVDLNVFKQQPIQDVMALKSSLNIPDGSKIIGHIGAFSHPKNHFYLLKIIEEYIKHNKSAIFVLLGVGPDFDAVVSKAEEMGISNNIRFVGSQKNVPLYLSMFDTFVLPSIHEGLPVVSAEAQALGLNTVFSDTIDHTCDMGLGIMKFVSIDDNSIGQWCKAIDNDVRKPTEEEIHIAFEKKRYDIESSVAYLCQTYKNLLTK